MNGEPLFDILGLAHVGFKCFRKLCIVFTFEEENFQTQIVWEIQPPRDARIKSSMHELSGARLRAQRDNQSNSMGVNVSAAAP